MMTPRFTSVLASAVTLMVATTAPAQTVLFSDTFDRANNTSLSADSAGMSGVLVALGYLESWQGSPVNENTWQINNNRLFKGNTGIMGGGAVNHNFTDASILAAGGFKVSLDIVSFGAATVDLPDRWGGFGVGLTQAEVNAFADENTGDTGPRGTIAQDSVASNVGTYGVDPWMHTGVADFYVGLSKENKVQVFAGGMLLNQFAVAPTASQTLAAEFNFGDFNAGSLVNYTVLFEGNTVTSGTFNWSNTGENYVGFSARDSVVNLDNLTISTVPEPSALALLLAGSLALLANRRRK